MKNFFNYKETSDECLEIAVFKLGCIANCMWAFVRLYIEYMNIFIQPALSCSGKDIGGRVD